MYVQKPHLQHPVDHHVRDDHQTKDQRHGQVHVAPLQAMLRERQHVATTQRHLGHGRPVVELQVQLVARVLQWNLQ